MTTTKLYDNTGYPRKTVESQIAHPRFGVHNNAVYAGVIETRPQPQQECFSTPTNLPYNPNYVAESERKSHPMIARPPHIDDEPPRPDSKQGRTHNYLWPSWYLEEADTEDEALPPSTKPRTTLAQVHHSQPDIQEYAEAKVITHQTQSHSISATDNRQRPSTPQRNAWTNGNDAVPRSSRDRGQEQISALAAPSSVRREPSPMRPSRAAPPLIQSSSVRVEMPNIQLQAEPDYRPVTVASSRSEYPSLQAREEPMTQTRHTPREQYNNSDSMRAQPDHTPQSPSRVETLKSTREANKLQERNKEEVCAWLTKIKLPLTLYDRLVAEELGDLGSLRTAPSEMLDEVTSSMTVIEKKKFQKAVKELKESQGSDQQPSNAVTKETKAATSSMVSMSANKSTTTTISTTTTTMTKSSATVSNDLFKPEEEEKEGASKDPEHTLRQTEECSTKARLQIEFDNEIKAVEHLIITTRSAKSGSVRFSDKALAILTASRDYHQQRAQRLQRILNDNTIALYATNRNDDHIALDARNFTQNARAKAVTAAGKRVGFGSVKHYHDNEKTGQELINTKKAIPQPDAAELEILRLNGK